MPESSSRQLSVRAVKRQAHFFSKRDNISKGHALELIAQQNGFSCWNDFRVFLLKEGGTLRDKIYLNQFDSSSHNYDQIRGVNFSSIKPSIQIKTSCISLFDKKFIDVNGLLSFFDSSVKDIISTSKDSLFICLLIALDSNVIYPFSDQDKFFEFLLNRYERLQYIEVISFPVEPPTTEKLNWISHFDKRMEDFLRGLNQ